MSKDCKDCKGCDKCEQELIYRRLTPPDCINLGVNMKPWNYYYFPINLVEGNLPKDFYESRSEIIEDIKEWKVANGYANDAIEVSGGFKSNFDTTGQALTYISSYPFESGYDFIRLRITPSNYGEYIDNHPSVLRMPPEYYRNKRYDSYSKLKDPVWLLNFPICGVSGNKEIDGGNFKLNKDCGNYKVEYRLRIRPLTFINIVLQAHPNVCEALNIRQTIPDLTYEDYKGFTNLIDAFTSETGHKWLGITPLRIETGIYSHLNNSYTPIVWSEGGYPQNTLSFMHTLWCKDEPRKLKCKVSTGNFETTSNSLVNLKMTPNVTVTDLEYTGVHTAEEEFVYYNINDTVTDGFFKTTNNNINNPGTFTFDYKSQLVGSITNPNKINQAKVKNKLKDLMVDYINPPDAPVENKTYVDMYIEYYDNGWVEALNAEYEVSNITNNVITEQFEFDVNSTDINFYDSNYITLSGGKSGPNDFIENANYPFRYSFNFELVKLTSETYPFSNANVSLPNYTKLMDDFVYEIEGFTDIDMEHEDEISIYLKVLPDNIVTSDMDVYNEEYYNEIGNGTNKISYLSEICSGNVLPNDCYPWGRLSVDPRTGWQEQTDVKYEPLLPLSYKYITNNVLTQNGYWSLADGVLRWGMSYNEFSPELAILIEDAWVRIVPDGEDCCD